MGMDTEKIIQGLKTKYGNQIILKEDKFFLTFAVEKAELLNIMAELKETYGFNHLRITRFASRPAPPEIRRRLIHLLISGPLPTGRKGKYTI